MKILLIDDDDVSRAQLARILRLHDHELLEAADGDEGIVAARAQTPDLVITDMKMPRRSGMDVLLEVRAYRPRTRVVLLTGHGDYETVIHAIEAGAFDYLRKPVSIEELLGCIERAAATLAAPRAIVLLAEDDTEALMRMAEFLTVEGHEVLPARDGRDALAVLERRSVDVIVTDLRMPGVDGLELLRAARRLARPAECVVMTGYGDEDLAIAALRGGACGFLRKPVGREQVCVSVRRALQRARER